MSNRLAASTSPYLLQHQDNPVDWWEPAERRQHRALSVQAVELGPDKSRKTR